MRISDWSSVVCSSDLKDHRQRPGHGEPVGVADADPPRQHGLLDEVVGGHGEGEGDRDDDRAAGEPDLVPVAGDQIGRASCRERVCQYVYILVVAESLNKKTNHKNTNIINT